MTTTFVIALSGALICAVATIEPPKNSCGISTSGMKLVAWSWLRTTADTSRPIVTAANAVSTTISSTAPYTSRCECSGWKTSTMPASTRAWIAASVNNTMAFDSR